jgi:hypothetical protein
VTQSATLGPGTMRGGGEAAEVSLNRTVRVTSPQARVRGRSCVVSATSLDVPEG